MTTRDYWRRRPVRPEPSPFMAVWDKFENRVFFPLTLAATAFMLVQIVRAILSAYFGG